MRSSPGRREHPPRNHLHTLEGSGSVDALIVARQRLGEQTPLEEDVSLRHVAKRPHEGVRNRDTKIDLIATGNTTTRTGKIKHRKYHIVNFFRLIGTCVISVLHT